MKFCEVQTPLNITVGQTLTNLTASLTLSLPLITVVPYEDSLDMDEKQRSSVSYPDTNCLTL